MTAGDPRMGVVPGLSNVLGMAGVNTNDDYTALKVDDQGRLLVSLDGKLSPNHESLRKELIDLMVEMGVADFKEDWPDAEIIAALRTVYRLGQTNKAGVARELIGD